MWLSPREHAGPFAVNVSTYIGAETGGVFGAVCATTGVILPSFIIILVIAHFLKAFQNKYVQGFLGGLKPVVVSPDCIGRDFGRIQCFLPLTASAFRHLQAAHSWFLFSFSLRPFVAAFKKMHPILIILAAAALGIRAGYMGLRLNRTFICLLPTAMRLC